MQSSLLLQASSRIMNGEVVGIPTETVYGLAGNAFSEKALNSIFTVKGRPNSDPLILHIPRSWGSVSKLVEKNLVDLSSFSDTALKTTALLMHHFWPGPLTIILPKNPSVPDLATSGLSTVALRMPNHPVAQELLEALQLPLAAPSANRFGRISPTTAAHVVAELGDRVPLVLDGGPCTIGVESSVVRVHADGEVLLLRPGGVTKENLEKVLAKPVTLHSKSAPLKNLESPGLLLNHYAPVKPLHLVARNAGVLAFEEKLGSARCIAVLWAQRDEEKETSLKAQLSGVEVLNKYLSDSGNAEESAKHLFALLREMDQSPAEVLFAESLGTSEGMALAVEDRLFKASTKT